MRLLQRWLTECNGRLPGYACYKGDMVGLIQNYDFDDAQQGADYFTVEFKLPEEDEFILTGASIYMQVRKKPGQQVAAEFSTRNELLEITGTYTFKFKEQPINIVADTYYYDILFIYFTGRRERLIGGKWTINPGITKKT